MAVASPPKSRRRVPAFDPAERWGPGLDDDEPPIDLELDAWRWTVANWPHARWAAWRRLAGELTGPGATADRVRSAEHAAFLELTIGGR